MLSGVVGALLLALSAVTLRLGSRAAVPLVLGVMLLVLLPCREPGDAR